MVASTALVASYPLFNNCAYYEIRAILATNLLTDIPAEAVNPTSLKIRNLISCANKVALGLPFLLFVTTLAVGGIILGNKLSTYIDGQKLKKGFGWFVLLMGLSILCKELFF